MGIKALPKEQVKIIVKKFGITPKKAEDFIRTIMKGLDIKDCKKAVDLILAIRALRRLR